jgi:hypothetical protein
MPALQAAALDDVLSVRGGHSDSEAMSGELMAVVRLVRTLHVLVSVKR